MTEMIEGSCRCGRLKVRMTKPPLLTMACHCRGCQKMSASAFSLSVAFPEDGFAVISGEPVIGGLHGPHSHHHHCDFCKSWVYTTVEPAMGFVNVRTTMLDAPERFPPFVETYTREKLPWASTPARHGFADLPSMDSFPALVAEYAKS